MDLVSEFSAIRASQAPSNGELKGIRAQDLHFENFSSEALTLVPTEELPLKLPQSPRQRAVLRKSINQPQRAMPYAKSHDNLRVAPPRPPRSPLSPECPVALPARTSSRTSSVLFDTFDPLASTSIERPYTNGGFRKPAPFHMPIPPPPSWDERKEDFSTRPLSHAVTTPGDEAWPLTASPSGTFGAELTDVQEEDEDVLSRARLSITSAELRMSQSVPALRRKSMEQADDKQETEISTTDAQPLTDATSNPLQPAFQLTTDSWESDIDWCYEHEVEANCDYQWDQCSTDEAAAQTEIVPPTTSQPVLQLRLQNEERAYRGRFRPSLLVPSTYDVPELSPISNASTPSDPRTPSNFLRPAHIRSPSHASSFKESHGFNLSPSLLIPTDFQSQMEQDALYNDHFGNDSTSGTIFVPEAFNHSTSPVDEVSSSTASFRSSDFSRGSARSSSSTRISANSHGSQDSMALLARAAGLSQEHRSIGSASSLPDLIPSTRRLESDLPTTVAALSLATDEDSTLALTSPRLRRNKSPVIEHGRRKDEIHSSAPAMLPLQKTEDAVDASGALSPVAEFPAMPKEDVVRPLVHGRKTSAPVISPSMKEFKGRARAKTSVTRGSYVLFPQV
ncbi:hypothetical protein EG329_009494 [Mollisiaceae sp. DMI_Dod_QoI]|nr:hypothetical protein EG329_009494 [Helotiales sp. DMI_Dod_QoI]